MVRVILAFQMGILLFKFSFSMCVLKYQNAWREEMSHALCGCVLQVCSMIQSAGSRQMPIYLATLDPCASSMPLEAICFNLVVTGTQKAP